MKFLYPQFLYAFAFLAIPVLIHLFNFKRTKTVYFSNISWLKQVDQQTKAQSKLKHLLLLLSRLLLLSFLILAFAQPFIPGSTQEDKGEKYIGIYIDNSFSMDSESENGHLLELAKQYAYALLDGYGKDQKFQVLSNDFMPKHQRLVNAEIAEQYINEIELSPRRKNISEVLNRQENTVLNKPGNMLHYIISDFQNGFLDEQTETVDNVILIPLTRVNGNNLSVDSIYFNSPIFLEGNTISASVLVRNHSDEAFTNLPLNLFLGESLKGLSNFSIAKNESKWVDISFTPEGSGVQLGKIQVDADIISFDNTLYFNFDIKDQIKVSHIYQEQANLGIQTVYNDPAFEYHGYSTKNNDLNTVLASDLIVLDQVEQMNSGHWNSIKSYVDKGGRLCIIPAINGGFNEFISSYLQLGVFQMSPVDSLEISKIETQHPLFYQVFEGSQDKARFPKANKHFQINGANLSPILKLENGDLALGTKSQNLGAIYVFSMPIDKSNSNFIDNGLLVPIFYNMGFLSKQSNAFNYEIGTAYQVKVDASYANDKTVHFKNTESDFISEINNQFAQVPQDLIKAGYYNLEGLNENKAQWFSFNYDRKESNLQFWSNNQLETFIDAYEQNEWSVFDGNEENLSSDIKRSENGESYWKQCIILALLFLGVETILMRIFN